MLKTRVIPTLLYKDVELVKGTGFDSWRGVGGVMQAVKVYNFRQVDELVFLDIAATQERRTPDFALVDDIADECFMPLTVGGGVRTLDDVGRLLKVGADKVAINSAAVETPSLVSDGATRFGSQCIVVSIDYRRHEDGRAEVFTESGTRPSGLDPADLAARVEELGAGEILLTSIERDGSMLGYDIDMLAEVCRRVAIPVVASGGAGTPEHMIAAVQDGKAAAVAAASIFHFTQLTPKGVKAELARAGIPVRL